jgi:uncharacterized membrane protein (DUF2068 family)
MYNKGMQREKNRRFPISFYVIVYKFTLGVGELLLGIGILLFGDVILQLFQNFKHQELFEDPHDIFVRLSEYFVPYFLEYKGWIIVILIVLGLIKIFGAIGLWYHKHWGLDLLVGLTFLVLPFELIGVLHHPSLPKLIFVVINFLIALYLVQFQPQAYFNDFKKRVYS